MSGLDSWVPGEHTHAGVTHPTYRKGSGPGVIVISEIPGITPKVAAFARRVRGLGCTVLLPVLFGEPGREMSAGYATRSIAGACVSREFAAFATRRTAPVAEWLRALARYAHSSFGGPGVGAVGMCFTGGFALGMIADAPVLAPVLSQPSVPFPFGAKRKADLGLSPSDLDAMVETCGARDLTVLGLRFTGDPLAPPERFATLREVLGDRFVGVEIDSAEGNAHGHRAKAHSVLTEDLVDQVLRGIGA